MRVKLSFPGGYMQQIFLYKSWKGVSHQTQTSANSSWLAAYMPVNLFLNRGDLWVGAGDTKQTDNEQTQNSPWLICDWEIKR